jgi:Protein of unknown function (DUF2917)
VRRRIVKQETAITGGKMTFALAHWQRTAVQLAAGQLWSFDPAEPETILRCVAGGCWATQAGDYADHHLRAGDELALRSRGRVVVQALAPTTLHLRAARRAAPAA